MDSSLGQFLSMLDICFDLDVDLDLQVGSTQKLHSTDSPNEPTLPVAIATPVSAVATPVSAAISGHGPSSVSSFLSFSSPMALLALWWTKLHTRHLREKCKVPTLLPKLILKNKHNRNFLAELRHARLAESEEAEVFCRRLESLLTAPFDRTRLRSQRVCQLQNYYSYGRSETWR